MSSGTGVGFLDDVVNVATQISTAGTVGYGKQGVKKGITTEAAVDVTKEITGAKAAEEANAMARDQFNLATEQAKQDRLNSQTAAKNGQIAASNSAGAARGSASSTTKRANTPVGDVSDFLGL